MNKTFSQLKEGDTVYLAMEDSEEIYKCPVLKMQKPATWTALTSNVPEYSVFIEWNNIWIELKFSDWSRHLNDSWHSFNHIIIFLEEKPAKDFLKKDLEDTITRCVKSKQNSQAALEDATTDEDITHWKKEINDINNIIERLKDKINKI